MLAKKKFGKLCYRRPRNISSEFCDSGHFDYYASSKMKMKMKKGKKEKSSEMKMAKTNLKMIKRLSRDLSMFSDVASGGQTGDSLIGEVKRKMMSKAMEFLHTQLQLMRKEQKELKKKNKKPKSKLGLSSSSSSSSSESGDGECVEVTGMSHLTSSALKQSKAIQEATLPISGSPIEEVVRVEVCMGGKCKKLGAMAVLEEFKKEVGAEGVLVVGCKCMGKCKNAPNVRFSNRHDGCNSS